MQEDLNALLKQHRIKSAVTRCMDSRGYKQADIARFMGARYQHVRNVLMQAAEKVANAVSPDVIEGITPGKPASPSTGTRACTPEQAAAERGVWPCAI